MSKKIKKVGKKLTGHNILSSKTQRVIKATAMGAVSGGVAAAACGVPAIVGAAASGISSGSATMQDKNGGTNVIVHSKDHKKMEKNLGKATNNPKCPVNIGGLKK